MYRIAYMRKELLRFQQTRETLDQDSSLDRGDIDTQIAELEHLIQVAEADANEDDELGGDADDDEEEEEGGRGEDDDDGDDTINPCACNAFHNCLYSAR
jgi:hypothetical protein